MTWAVLLAVKPYYARVRRGRSHSRDQRNAVRVRGRKEVEGFVVVHERAYLSCRGLFGVVVWLSFDWKRTSVDNFTIRVNKV